MKDIGIVGYGHVGKAMRRLLGEYAQAIYDPKPSWDGKSLIPCSKEVVNNCDLAIVCVPTPEAPNGGCDISIVDEVVAWLKTPLILIKSTVGPGTTDHLKKKYRKRICMSPEYYGESKYWIPEDWSPKGWPFLIVGGDPKDTQEIVDILMPILGPMKTYWQTDALTAEVVKYVENIWGAMKVTWANEMCAACEKIGVSWEEVRELWALDPRVDKCHTAVFKENRGFGGKCFPKDLHAFIKYCEGIGFDPKLLKAMDERNDEFREMNK